MTRPLLCLVGLGQFLLLWLLLPLVPVPRVEAQRTRPSLFCPVSCEPMRCPPLPTCSSGAMPVLDRCQCCRVCAAAEGEVCGGARSRPCAPGLQCGAPFSPRRLGGARLGTCGCPAVGATVCGSDGRTYPSLCALRAENRAARRRGALPAVPVQKGDCGDPGERQGFAFSEHSWNFHKERISFGQLDVALALLCSIGLGDSTPCSRFSFLFRKEPYRFPCGFLPAHVECRLPFNKIFFQLGWQVWFPQRCVPLQDCMELTGGGTEKRKRREGGKRGRGETEV